MWGGLSAAVSRGQRRPGWLAISGGPPRGAADRGDRRHWSGSGVGGARVAVDTHGPALPAAVEPGRTLVKINRYEAADLLDVPPTPTPASWPRASGRSGGLVVLTDAHGEPWRSRQRRHRARLPDVHGHYPVGSGDSFLGGLLTEFDRGAALPDALRTAAAAGAANALVPGPGRFELISVDRAAP